MAYAEAERGRNTLSGAISGAGTGAGIGTAIAPGPGTAIGAGIGAIIGGISGYFLTDDEKNEVIEMYRKGELDDDTVAQIEGTLSRRYNMMRRSQSTDMARRGLTNSSFGARQISDSYNSERESLAAAITGESERRQAIGFQMSDAAGAGRAQDVASGVGALFQGYQSYQEGEAMKTDAASNDRLAAAIGQLFEKGSTPGVSPYGKQASTPKVASSKSGAGNPFARHRTRQPNVTLTWDLLKNPKTPAAKTSVKPSWALGG